MDDMFSVDTRITNFDGQDTAEMRVDLLGDRLVFRLTVSNDYGLQGEDEVSVEVIDKAASSGGAGEGACFLSVGLLAW
jgi:hypothetical protein